MFRAPEHAGASISIMPWGGRPPGLSSRQRRDAGDAEVRQTGAGQRGRAVEIDAAAGVLDDENSKAFAARVFGRIANAKIEGEAGQKHPEEAALAQIADEAGQR